MKPIIYAVVFILAMFITFWLTFGRNTYFTKIDTQFSEAGIPLVKASIQNKIFYLKFDLGSKFQITLPKDILTNLKKKKAGLLPCRDMHGNSYKTPAYLLSKISLGNFSFDNIITSEESDLFLSNATFWVDENLKTHVEPLGSIGRTLLDKKNLLLDFARYALYITNDIKKLNTIGYNVSSWQQRSFTMGRAGIVVSIRTDMGDTRFAIDTGSTVSFIRSRFIKNEKNLGNRYGMTFSTTSQFVINNKDFGPMHLYHRDITPELSEIDGILGMDFLKNHKIYIDYQKLIIYIDDKENYDEKTS